MKIILVFALLFTPILSFAQESESEESKFSIGINFSPNCSYRTLKYPENLQNLVDAREELEHPSLGFNTGIEAHYLPLKNLEIVLAVQLSRQTHMFREVPLTNIAGDDSLGFADNQLRYHYLGIPLRVNYRIVNQKFFVHISAGVSINQFLSDKSRSWITYSNGDTEVVNSESGIKDFNKTLIGLVGGIGLGYHINEKLNMRLEPLFRYSLTPLADAPIEQYNYSIGCQIGVNVKL